MPHVGAMLAQLLKEKRLTKAWLCRRLNVNGTAANQYIRQQSMHAALMWKLGQVLEFDFFAWLSKEFPMESSTPLEQDLQQQLIDLKKENELYKNLLTDKLG
jgi:transcriptional regulator with XRE-family HTH domain